MICRKLFFSILLLKDKLRLECVSKQFQRTVFQRQYELYINMGDPEDHKNYLDDKNLYLIRTDPMCYPLEEQGFNSFQALLKKCPSITSIKLDGFDCNGYKMNQVFQLIIVYLNLYITAVDLFVCLFV